ncbi:alpha/beta hydrolase, partial [Oleiphilus sp. HI0118]
QFGDEYRVIAPDLLGHGENIRDIAGSYHIADQVAFVNELMAKLSVERFHLVGNSMGGAISSLYAARHPEQVLSMTLISPAGVHDFPSEMDALLKEGKNPLIPESEEQFYTLLDFVMSEQPFIPAAIAKAEAEVSVSRAEINKKIFADIRSDMELGLEKEYKNISAPTLIIWGDQDKAINVKNIDRYAALVSNSQKVVLEGIGHVAMIEVPEYTAELMRKFLKN